MQSNVLCYKTQDKSLELPKGWNCSSGGFRECPTLLVWMTGEMSSNTASLSLWLRSYSDLMKYTKVKGSDFAFWRQTLMLPRHSYLNYSSFISGWVLVMDDLHPAYQIAHLKEKNTLAVVQGLIRDPFSMLLPLTLDGCLLWLLLNVYNN